MVSLKDQNASRVTFKLFVL